MNSKVARLKSRLEWLVELRNELDLAGCHNLAEELDLEIGMLEIKLREVVNHGDSSN